MIDCAKNNGRHPYTNFQCRYCKALIRAIVSYGEHVIRQHEARCENATEKERATWNRTKRWPKQCPLMPLPNIPGETIAAYKRRLAAWEQKK